VVWKKGEKKKKLLECTTFFHPHLFSVSLLVVYFWFLVFGFGFGFDFDFDFGFVRLVILEQGRDGDS
jgi:hypothetical protein